LKVQKGSQTEKNLLLLFALESQDRNRYSYFASQAKKDGFVQISTFFEETANHIKEHAKRFFKFFDGGEVEFTVCFPATGAGSTLENLKSAGERETSKHIVIYPNCAQEARQEGFLEIALVLEALALTKKYHAKRFLNLADNIENGQVFKRDEVVTWRCRNCGFITDNQKAPENCAACAHHQAHFELFMENY
jgi:rubrerythrin